MVWKMADTVAIASTYRQVDYKKGYCHVCSLIQEIVKHHGRISLCGHETWLVNAWYCTYSIVISRGRKITAFFDDLPGDRTHCKKVLSCLFFTSNWNFYFKSFKHNLIQKQCLSCVLTLFQREKVTPKMGLSKQQKTNINIFTPCW